MGIKDPADVKAKEVLDSETVNFFRDTIKVIDKRYEVCLPWKDGHPILEDNKDKAEKRLITNTRKLQRSGGLKEYDEIFKDWLKEGIIEIAPENSIIGHYLPHQAVVKNSSLTTRMRPVFDASAKDSKGNSLNDCLEKGPNLVELIPKLLMQFRKHAIGVTADIKKAFLQIGLAPSDRDFLKFLWWKDKELSEIVMFRHCRVVFGVSSSPFLLGATLAHHLDQSPENLKETAMHLKRSFYVDNCLTSLETKEEVEKFIAESKKLMSSAQFELRGWITSLMKNSEKEDFVPVLGLSWDVERDELLCNVNIEPLAGSIATKRILLSIVQRIFDPIGFTCPATLTPKLLLQRTWKIKCGWDDELPQDITEDFRRWLSAVRQLKECRIPRRLTAEPYNKCLMSLHIFCDASKDSFAACMYLRTSYKARITVRLIQSKSRVAPLKKVTIPRLELLAALIGSRMYCEVKGFLNLNCETYFWSDSTVALTWIKRETHWNTFVGNRVTEIREHTDPDNWRFVPGQLNPADLPSRGCNAKSLLQSRWWEGPDWLRLESDKWPTCEIAEVDEQLVNSERRKTVVTSISCCEPNFTDVLSPLSNYHKNLRMLSWMYRFINRTQRKKCENCKELTFEEVDAAETKLLGLIQATSFNDKGNTLKMMHTFKDKNGLIRVRTKLVLGEDEEDFKCPIVLPGNHTVVHRLVEYKHKQLKHAGTSTLIANLREKYWIIGIRRIAKKIRCKCVICKRFCGKSVDPPFAPLPKDRIKYGSVFEVTGIDLAGPLYTLSGEKVWIVLFTCAIYRAVHLELTKALSTESFIMALRRFIARRGRINIIYSDNGTNFVGTNNAMKELDWEKIMAFSTIEKIKWNFNPPTAAWWGGFWERLVRMVKELLRRILGRRTVSYVELETILCDCEATMNSRPLTYLEDETTSLKPLTPACFIQGIPNNDVDDLDCIDDKSLNRRVRYLQKLRADLRTRFRNEYLAMLVHRGQRRGETIQVGDVVLIGTAGKRINWPLGLVTEVFPGRDLETRVARVKMALGEKIRPVQNLYPLEVSRPTALNTELTTNIKEKDITTKSGRLVKIPQRLNL